MQLPLIAPPPPPPHSPTPLQPIGTQGDIRYYDAVAKGVLNSPETTGMGFWSINPYVGCAFGCAYCYARYAHRYVAERAATVAPDATELVELPPWLAFERRIFVKRNAVEVLRETLQTGWRSKVRGQMAEGGGAASRLTTHGSRLARGPRSASRLTRLWAGETVVIGTATDPYQPAERSYRVTRGILEVLAEERGLSVVIITKSALITRDLDVLCRLANRSSLTVHLSLITLDRELARRIEPRAPTPEARVRAVERMAAAGLDVGINIMPVLPGITDRPAMLDGVVRRVAAAGASHINACALRLRVTARRRYLPFIEAEFPALAGAYRTAYSAGHQMGDAYREGLRRFLRARCRKHGISYGTPEVRGSASDGSARVGSAWAATEPDDEMDAVRPGHAPTAPAQLALFRES
ncbi:MAG TPA: radical SAM protein [Gemmatimonadaceae bacterium]